jgi:hypothetical protein
MVGKAEKIAPAPEFDSTELEPKVIDWMNANRFTNAWEAALLSSAISLKRMADAMTGPSVQGSVLYWLETIADAANAGRR